MRSKHKTLGEDRRQGSESPYLAAAIKYLTQNTQRPLWPGQRQIKNGLPETPNPLYPPLTNSRASFITSLNFAFKKYFGPNFPKHGRFPKYSSDEGFLDYFLEHLNTPDRPSEYDFVSTFDPRKIIWHRLDQAAESLTAKLGPIGVEVLNKVGCPRTAFPVAFLEILQLVNEEDPSLQEDHLIAKALLEYMKFLDKMETPDTAITETCMEVSSLALQKENLEAFRETALFDQLIEQLTQ
jgi:hypothetical protein